MIGVLASLEFVDVSLQSSLPGLCPVVKDKDNSWCIIIMQCTLDIRKGMGPGTRILMSREA